jgi:SAM-dependent methyltransferase
MTNNLNAQATSDNFEFAALNEANNYRAALMRDFDSYLYGNVLEVGAGIGHITAELRKKPKIRKLLSIEPDPDLCDQLRSHFPDHDLLRGTVGDLQSPIAWDAILSINVLEHIERDREELGAYHNLLRESQGALCLFVPARPEIYAPIDRDFGHFRRYTKRELQAKLEKAGFRIVRFRYYNFVGYFAWWMNFCVLKKRSFDVQAVRFFDRAVFPVVHAFETHICPPPIGQSLIVVAVAR